MRMKEFCAFHPLVNFVYFAFVIAFSMVFIHPVCLCISLFASFIYMLMLYGARRSGKKFLYILPIVLISGMMNPLFNHTGDTTLAILPNGSPVTAEAFAYGIAAAMLICSVLCWFLCAGEVFESDKFIYLFGKIIPSLSLVISITLRLVPEFRRRLRLTSQIPVSDRNKSITLRARRGVRLLSAMITWSLENSIQTADSMKSRGYGLLGRSSFSVFRIDMRDVITLAVIVALGGYVLIGAINGGVSYQYFPRLSTIGTGGYRISVFTAYLALCLVPIVIELWEAARWTVLKSRI